MTDPLWLLWPCLTRPDAVRSCHRWEMPAGPRAPAVPNFSSTQVGSRPPQAAIVSHVVSHCSLAHCCSPVRPSAVLPCVLRGTIPNKRLETFVCDIRCMVSSTPSGFQPLAVYARRALLPLKPTLESADDSWQMLGTNLSIKKADGTWTTDTSRLLLMDCKDFNRLGIAIDDLIEAYVQTVLATLAIDRMAKRLTHGTADGQFDRQLYASLNNDHSLLGEIMQ